MFRPRVVMQVLLLLLTAALGAAISAADQAKELIAAYDQAVADGDSTAKRISMKAVNGLGKEHDDEVFKVLVQAVGDRQTHDEAVMALRARTGMEPTINNRGTGYPGYPNSDEASDWNNWLAQRKKDKDQQKKLADQDKKLKELETAEKKKDGKDKGDGKDKPDDGKGQPAPGDDKAGGDDKGKPKTPLAVEPPSDLGRPDRIIFKNGGSLVCYILSKRSDSDGTLQSVRIVHLDGGGEEILAADLIARIEEDIR